MCDLSFNITSVFSPLQVTYKAYKLRLANVDSNIKMVRTTAATAAANMSRNSTTDSGTAHTSLTSMVSQPNTSPAAITTTKPVSHVSTNLRRLTSDRESHHNRVNHRDRVSSTRNAVPKTRNHQ